MNRIILLSGLLLISLLVFTCFPKTAPAERSRTPQSLTQEAQTIVKGSWEMEWDRTLKAAKKERRVVVYAGGSIGLPLRESLPLIKKKFDLELDIISARGAELSGKLVQERTNGIYMTVVFLTGSNSLFGTIKKSGATEPLDSTLILPEVKDPDLWYSGKIPWADEDHHIFRFFAYPSPEITINTNLVAPGELQSYYDLLLPKWKGKIIMSDPTVVGSGFNSFSTMIMNKVLDLDFYRQLIRQDLQLTRNLRLQMDWVARGKVAITLGSEGIAEYRAAGAPVAEIIPEEGAYMSSGTGSIVLMNRSPHPDAARVIINWVLTKEGQTIMQNVIGSQSARVDIRTEGVDPSRLRQPGVKYHIGANSVEKWVLQEQDKYLEMAREVFAPLLK